jgi:hypothetical protein
MTAGGVEDTALHYKREISVVVKKTTSLARRKRFRTCVTFLRMSPLDAGAASTPIVLSYPFHRLKRPGAEHLRPSVLANPACLTTSSIMFHRSRPKVGRPRRAEAHPASATHTRRNTIQHVTRLSIEAERAQLHAPTVRRGLVVKSETSHRLRPPLPTRRARAFI